MHEESDEETIRMNYIKLCTLTHADIAGCGVDVKTMNQATPIAFIKKGRKRYNRRGREQAEEELSRRNKWKVYYSCDEINSTKKQLRWESPNLAKYSRSGHFRK